MLWHPKLIVQKITCCNVIVLGQMENCPKIRCCDITFWDTSWYLQDLFTCVSAKNHHRNHELPLNGDFWLHSILPVIIVFWKRCDRWKNWAHTNRPHFLTGLGLDYFKIDQKHCEPSFPLQHSKKKPWTPILPKICPSDFLEGSSQGGWTLSKFVRISTFWISALSDKFWQTSVPLTGTLKDNR